MLHIAHCLPAHWTPIEPLGALVAGHIVTTGTEHGGNEFVHAHGTQPLILDLE